MSFLWNSLRSDIHLVLYRAWIVVTGPVLSWPQRAGLLGVCFVVMIFCIFVAVISNTIDGFGTYH